MDRRSLCAAVTLAVLLLAGCVGRDVAEGEVPDGGTGSEDGSAAADAAGQDAGQGCLPGCTPGEMVEMEGGEFWQGCFKTVDTECDYSEDPYHKVTLSPYRIDKYEVTMGEFAKCIDAKVCAHRLDDGDCIVLSGTAFVPGILEDSFREPMRPVVCVDWHQARAYCEWVGKRLPTEAEWEFAARGSAGYKYPWGNSPKVSCELAVIHEPGSGPEELGCGTQGTLPIGSRPGGASPSGVQDMIGNVWEWAADWFDASYYQNSPDTDPKGPATGSVRTVRGGGWSTISTQDLRASNRHGYDPKGANSSIGFRCAASAGE
ncbi:MAG: SUMF1/EgtB/PvdO family nonheme iron enzyme [Deltaproteobacteria bacterium]|nr:SUMF1/EgtB/PvdO family nonheme iron enzyme [Deltaproteobacteria bacterium]